MPLVGESNGKKCGVGIMQICNKKETTPNIVWNWKMNILAGLSKFDTSYEEAEDAHVKERGRLNAERAENGLPLCPPGVPTKLTNKQIQQETIRRYNCGVEFR